MVNVHIARNIVNAEMDHEGGPAWSYPISPGSGWIMFEML
jgi:hypothetical protein